MQEARMLGNYVGHLAKKKGLSISDLSQILNCSEHQVCSFIKGHALVSFEQLEKLAQALGETLDNIIVGDADLYKKTVVHCMHSFSKDENREKILDLFDCYVDIKTAVDNSKQ